MSLWRPRSKRRSRRIVWGLDARQLAWHGAGDALAMSAAHTQALPQALAHLSPGTSVHVVAGNDIAVHWLQTPPSSVASLDELKLVAAARCTHLYGGSPQDWWVAGDWSATEPFVCAALPYAVVAPLQQALAASKLGAHWHTAWSVACDVHANTFPAEGWSALRSPTRMMLWHCRQGRVDCLGTQSISPDAPEEDVAAHALRQAQIETLRDAALASGPMHWMALPAAQGVEPSEAGTALALGTLLEGSAS